MTHEHDGHEHDGLAEDTILLSDENGKEHKFRVVDMLEVDGQEYAILLPADEEDLDIDEEGTAIVLRLEQDENGDQVLCEIDSDEEWAAVEQAWDEAIADD